MLISNALCLTIFITIGFTITQSKKDILIDSLDLSSVNQTYTLKIFNSKTNSCETIQNLKTKKYMDLEMIYINDDTSSDYKHLTGLDNSENHILVGIRNKFELTLIVSDHALEYKEISLKIFDSKIIKLEPHWFYGRLYVLTYEENETLATVFEIDLHSRVIAKLFSFKTINPILMVANPFQGTIGLNYAHKFLIINILFKNEFNKNSLSFEDNKYELKKATYENIYIEFGACREFEQLIFVTSSSQINGFTEEEFYYVISKPGMYMECQVFNKECYCNTLDFSTNKTIIDKIKKIYEQNTENKKCIKKSNKNYSLQGYKFYSNSDILTPSLKSCLKICKTPDWKIKLNKNINSDPHSWNKIEVNNVNEFKCVNSLDIDSSIKEFGYAISSMNTSNNLLAVQFRKKYMSSLRSPDCSNLEMAFRYTVNFKKVSNLREINSISTGEYKTLSTLEGEVIISLETDQTYEINVQIQTPFDTQPYNVGSYLLENDIKNTIVEPSYKGLFLADSPYILDDYWSQKISDDGIMVSLLVKADIKNKDLDILKNMFYVITNLNSKETVSSSVYKINQKEIHYFHSDPTYYQVSFKIDNLIEDDMYRLRISNKNNEKEISSLSNLISFQTLKRPLMRIIDHDHANNILLELRIRCRYNLNDITSPESSNFLDDPSHYNICNYFTIYLAEDVMNSTNWTMAYHEQIFSSDNSKSERLRRSNNSNDSSSTESMDLVKIVKISNFSYDTQYSMSLMISYYTNVTLNSEIVGLKTHKKMMIKKISLAMIALIIFFSIIGVFFMLAIFTGLKKNRFNYKLFRVFGIRKDEISLENSEFIEKMTRMNMLYSWTDPTNKKTLADKVKKLKNYDESQLKILKNIGKGTFGEVFEGLLRVNDTVHFSVAIKKLKSEATETEKIDLIKEAIALSSFSHDNLIKFHGVCLEGDNPKYLILEFMKLGDLLTYLRSTRKLMNFNLKQALKISIDVAKGCEFLEQSKMVHRDLAARNCLVTTIEGDNNEFDILVKLGDFGLAREMYASDYYKQAGDRLLPIRWMSPESIFDGLFTTQSDIWSFGVLLFEIFSIGRQPYPGMDNKQVINFIKNSGVPQIPDKCPTSISNIMTDCWGSINSRPSFKTILALLNSIFNNSDLDSENFLIYNDVVSLNPHKQIKVSSSSSPNEYDDDFLSKYTSDTSTTMLTNLSSVSMPITSDRLQFIEKYTDQYILPDGKNENSKLLMDYSDSNETSSQRISKL